MLVSCGAPPPIEPDSITAEVTGLRWTLFQGIEIPEGDQGPSDRSSPAAPSGYERNPAGAALAAISGTIRLSVANDSQWREVGNLIAPNSARDTWAVSRAQVSITAPANPAQAPRILGYLVPQFTDHRAQVKVVSALEDGSMVMNTVNVVWAAHGDWLISLSEGSVNPVTALEESPAELIRLEGES